MANHAAAVVVLAGVVPAAELKKAKTDIPDGSSIGVDMSVTIAGRLTRANRTSQKQTAKLLNEATVAELLRRCGVTREAAEKHLYDIAVESIIEKIPMKKKIVDEAPHLLEMMHGIQTRIVNRLPKQPRDGRIDVSATYSLSDVKVA